MRRSTGVLLCCCSAACGDPSGAERPGGWVAEVDTLGDTVVVRTLGGSVWGPGATLHETVSIGVSAGAPEYEIGNPVALAVGASGEMYVLDQYGPVVRLYGPDGEFDRYIGREGAGPGEIRRPDGMLMLGQGLLAVRDPGNARVTVFAPDGSYRTTYPISGSLRTGRPMVRDGDGGFMTPVIVNPAAPVEEWSWGMARYGPAGPLDTVPSPTLGHEPALVVGRSPGGSSASQLVPFTAQEIAAYGPGGMLVIGVSSSYSFQVRSADGSLLRVERATEALPVAPEEAELRREEIERNMRASFPGWRWNGQPIPSTKPAFTHFIVGDDGRIWVRVHTAGERRRETADGGEERVVYAETTRFDVFESDGRFLGTVDSRVDLETYPLPVARGDSIWGIVRDGLGVPTVRRFVVTRVDSVAQIDEVDDGRGG